MTIDEIYNQWIELKAPLITKQTLRSYVAFYSNHIYSLLGERHIDTLHYIDYQKLANNLLSSGMKPKTVKNVFGVLSGIYDFAKINEWYTGEKYPALVQFPRFDNKFYVTISPDLQKQYIQAIMGFHEPVYKDIFLFLLHGRRVGEVLNLKWEYLDLNEKMMYIPATDYKSRKHVSFMLTDRLVEVLKHYQLEAIDRQGTPFITGHVFLNPITLERYANITKPWQRLLKRSKLPHMKLHAIRHLVATYLINELGIPVQDVSVMLGHSDITITQRYHNPKPSIARNCTQSLFDACKTKSQLYIEDLDASFKVAESLKTAVNLTKSMFP